MIEAPKKKPHVKVLPDYPGYGIANDGRPYQYPGVGPTGRKIGGIWLTTRWKGKYLYCTLFKHVDGNRVPKDVKVEDLMKVHGVNLAPIVAVRQLGLVPIPKVKKERAKETRPRKNETIDEAADFLVQRYGVKKAARIMRAQLTEEELREYA